MPPRYVMDQAPLLAQLKDNAIYHVLAWRRPRLGYSLRLADGIVGQYAYTLVMLFGIAYWSGLGSLVVMLLILFLPKAYIWTVVRRRKRDASLLGLLGIDEDRLQDLKLIPIDVEDLALGFWGYRCQIDLHYLILPSIAPGYLIWWFDPSFESAIASIVVGIHASFPIWLWCLARHQAALGLYLALIETGEYLNLSGETGMIQSGVKAGQGLLNTLIGITIFILILIINETRFGFISVGPMAYALISFLMASSLGWATADQMNFARKDYWSRLKFNAEWIQRRFAGDASAELK